MHRRSLLVALVLLVVTVLIAQEKAANLPSEETVNAFLQQTFGYDPAVKWKIVAIKPSIAEGLTEVNVTLSNAQGQSATTLYVTQDGKHALTGEIMPFGAKPYESAKEALLKGINGPGRGPEKSTVTIVEFSDLQCPHCKDAQPVLDKLFQNYPLPMHNWAAKAAYYADCVGRSSNEAFWKFVQGTFDQQANLTESNADEKLTAIADASGVKGADVAVCAAKPDTKSRIDKSIALGTSVGVTGTPTVYVNGRRIGNVVGVPPEVLKGLVEFAAKQ
jgi:protein-disulfide isomerase